MTLGKWVTCFPFFFSRLNAQDKIVMMLPDSTSQLRRMLGVRLLVASIAIGLLAGIVAYRFQASLIDEHAKELAVTATRHFETTASQAVSSNGTAIEHGELARQLGRGNLIGIRVYGAAGQLAFESWTGRPDGLDNALGTHLHAWPAHGSDHRNRIELKDGSLIQVVMPLLGQTSQVIGYLEGVYLLDDATLANMRRQVWVSIATAGSSSFAVGLLLFPILSGLLGKVAGLSDRLLVSNLSLMRSLGAAVAKRDSDTDAHNYRVALYSVALAESMSVPKEEIRHLLMGAFLHDVGKIGIPDRILLKPGKLNEEEFAVMKNHATLGLDIIAGNEWLKDAACVIRHHHERFDGAGYPDGLAGSGIPLNARMFAVVDVFDALMSARPYKIAFPLDAALEMLATESGKHFDPSIVKAFDAIANDCYQAIGLSPVADLKSQLDVKLKTYFEQM